MPAGFFRIFSIKKAHVRTSLLRQFEKGAQQFVCRVEFDQDHIAGDIQNSWRIHLENSPARLYKLRQHYVRCRLNTYIKPKIEIDIFGTSWVLTTMRLNGSYVSSSVWAARIIRKERGKEYRLLCRIFLSNILIVMMYTYNSTIVSTDGVHQLPRLITIVCYSGDGWWRKIDCESTILTIAFATTDLSDIDYKLTVRLEVHLSSYFLKSYHIIVWWNLDEFIRINSWNES